MLIDLKVPAFVFSDILAVYCLKYEKQVSLDRLFVFYCNKINLNKMAQFFYRFLQIKSSGCP